MGGGLRVEGWSPICSIHLMSHFNWSCIHDYVQKITLARTQRANKPDTGSVYFARF